MTRVRSPSDYYTLDIDKAVVGEQSDQMVQAGLLLSLCCS